MQQVSVFGSPVIVLATFAAPSGKRPPLRRLGTADDRRTEAQGGVHVAAMSRGDASGLALVLLRTGRSVQLIRMQRSIAPS